MGFFTDTLLKKVELHDQINDFQGLYDYLSDNLFLGQVPATCRVVVRPGCERYGYFPSDDGQSDVIVMNPRNFFNRSGDEIAAMLAQDMTHAWQRHCGTVGDAQEWSRQMQRIGIQEGNPNDSIQPTTQAGHTVCPLIVPDGYFDMLFSNLKAAPYINISYPGGTIGQPQGLRR